MDSNPTRARYADNKKAFTDVLGDPYAPEPTDGWYNIFKQRSTVGAVKNNFDEGRGTRNPAQPSQVDFFCDVEKVIHAVIKDKTLLNRFVETYIVGDIEANQLSQAQRNGLEQRIGRKLRAYHISPVREYFKTIRRPVES